MVIAPPASSPGPVRPPPAAEPAPPDRRAPAAALPCTNSMSDMLGSVGGTRPYAAIAPVENTYATCASGSYDPPAQLVPACALDRVARGPSIRLATGGVNMGPSLYFETSFKASALRAGVKSIRSSVETPVRS